MNTVLRQARLQAKLTQEELASALGTTAVSIWRWEAGHLPSPFYRKALCRYFLRTPAEFGWPEPARRGTRLPPLPSLLDPLITTDLGTQLIGQQHLLAHLRELLCATSGPQHVGLTGLIGSGKTAVAHSLSATPQIQEAFAGVLWASLGPEAHPMHHLRRWANLLGIDALPAEPGAAQDVLHAAIGPRRILFVLDDVWAQADVCFFRIGSPVCRYLVTTRQPGLARLLCQQVLSVQDLTEDEAFTLLAAGLPLTAVREHLPQFHTLIQRVGKLPLALVLMREHLRKEASMQPPRRLRDAISHLTQRCGRPGPPDLLQMEVPWQTTTLSAAIRQCEKTLPHPVRVAFRLLTSQFQAAPFTETEASALILHGSLQQELDCLTDAGLLAWGDDGCYHFHPVIAEYGRLTGLEQPQDRQLLDAPGFSALAYHGKGQPFLN